MDRTEVAAEILDYIEKDINVEQQHARATALIAAMMAERQQGFFVRLRKWIARQIQPIGIPGIEIHSKEEFDAALVRLIVQGERALQLHMHVVTVQFEPTGREVHIGTWESSKAAADAAAAMQKN